MLEADPIKPPTRSGLKRHIASSIVLAIFGAAALAYFPSINGGILWDDAAHVTAPALQSWHGLGRIWFELGATQQYYPVLHSAFWIEHRLWGDSVLGYHLLNIALHATAACLFAVVLTRLRPATDGRPRWPGTEWLAAAIFALHPVCVESVAWISEQKNTLSLVFYLLSVLAYLRFDRERQGRWYGLAFGFFVLAVLTKSVTATLPAALLLGLYWRHGRLVWSQDVRPLLPWFAVGIGAGLFTAWVEWNYVGAKWAAYDLGLPQRCFLAGRVMWFYLGKLVWPSNLSFIYPRWHVGADWSWSLGLIALLITLVALWRLRHWNRGPLVAVLFFAGSLFPALGFFNVYPFVFSYVADHWQYLPCLGLIALVTEGGASLMRRLVHSGRTRWLAGASGTALLAVLFALTWRQSGLYRDDVTLYTDTLAKNPACWMARNNLGLHLMDAGDAPAAIGQLKEAVRLKPDNAESHNNLGNALTKIGGHPAEAVAEFEAALQLQPGMAEAQSNLGVALVNIPDRFADGIAHLRAALQLRPDYAETHNSLGVALARVPGQLSAAIAEYEAALRLKPDYPEATNNLGNALVRAGRAAEAVTLLAPLQRAHPGEAGYAYNLGTALATAGRPAEAVAAFERSLQLQPDNPDAHNNLGNVLSELGRDTEAIGHYRAALRLDPNSAESHFNLGRALRNTGDGAETIAEYREAARLAPGAAPVWNSLGSALYQAGRSHEALAAYTEAVRLQPDSALFHNNLGLTFTATGRLAEAINQLREAVRLAPGYADAHYNLGVALQQAGRADEAAAEFRASAQAQR